MRNIRKQLGDLVKLSESAVAGGLRHDDVLYMRIEYQAYTYHSDYHDNCKGGSDCRKFTVIRHYNKYGEKTNKISALGECQLELISPLEIMALVT